MRRHATASSSGPDARKPSGLGSSPPSGRLRLTILLATVAAFLLVPAAQAFAASSMTVFAEGSGSGEVSSVGGYPAFGGAFEGSPAIECSYASPGPATGVCEDEATTAFEAEGVALHPVAAPGSEFVEWQISESMSRSFCPSAGLGEEEKICLGLDSEGANKEWIAGALFCLEGTGVFVEEASYCNEGPTNRRTLTVKKSGPANSAGTVKSKPKGINCASACSEAQASLYKNTPVSLEAKPASGSTFNPATGWSGCDSVAEGKCIVAMSEAKEVTAEFGGASKEILNPVPLTLTKEGTGFGTVKATGLACEPECASTVVNYSSGGGPKAKPATIVTLVATTAAGSEFAGWSGCESEPEGKCVVTMSEAKSVTAEFTALPKNTLTVKKSGPANSAGTVKSKPKAVNCASACTEAVASLSSDTTVSLEAKPASGSTFNPATGWSGCDSVAEGKCIVAMSAAKEVTAEFGGASKEILNPVALTLTKAGSSYGTVKAKGGVACEVLCTSTVVNYSSGGGPKAKPAAIVTLEAFPAPGSQTVVWSGCESEPEGKCVVTMSEAKNVTATFDELE